PIGVADRRALLYDTCARVELLAVAPEARRPVRDADGKPVVIGQAEAALAIAEEHVEVARASQLVVVEAEQVPVVVRPRHDVVEPTGLLVDPRAARVELHVLPYVHRVGSRGARAANPEDARAAVVHQRRESK